MRVKALPVSTNTKHIHQWRKATHSTSQSWDEEMEWIGWECLTNRWQSHQRTLWSCTPLLHSSRKNWYFLHDPFHRIWIKHSSKINIKPTQWRKCQLRRLRRLDDFGWIDYASQKYRSHFALHPPELARDWWAAISQQVVSTCQRSELTLPPIKPLPFRSHANCGMGVWGRGHQRKMPGCWRGFTRGGSDASPWGSDPPHREAFRLPLLCVSVGDNVILAPGIIC